ncbi:MAG: hypothetical protein LBF19_01810 [Prevotellaceae bacterium]|jgi:hypothetical protein|nr:hypothetical protein [Prevotellaceae bacterium]
MSRQSILNKPDRDVLAQAKMINQQSHLHETDCQIEAPRLTEFDAVLTNAETTYAANIDPATKNAITSANKKVAFGELKHFEGMYINYLEVNTNVPDAALDYMGLRPRHPHAHLPLPIPPEAPVISVLRQHDELTVYAARPEQDQPTSGVGLPRYHGFAIRYTIDGHEAQTVNTTRLHHILHFEHADEGKAVTITAAWVNPRLETGPWCDPLTIIIG